MKSRKWFISIVALNLLACEVLFVLFPPKVEAFLTAAITVIVASAISPFIAGILALLAVNLVIFFKHIPKPFWKILVFVISLLLLIFTSWLVYKRYEQLRVSNAGELSLRLNSTTDWQSYLGVIQQSSEDDPQRKIVRQSGQYCYNKDASIIPKMDTETFERLTENEGYKAIDVSCPDITVKNGKKACGLSWELFSNVDNEQQVTKILATYGISKQDNMLVFCEYGVTASHVAYILNHYGYLAKSSNLLQADKRILEIEDHKSLQDSTVLIDTFKYKKGQKYLYVLINDRDKDAVYSQSSPNILKYIDSVSVVNATNLPLTYTDDKPISSHLISTSDLSKLSLDEYQILCKNALQCYLTRHFLNSLNIKGKRCTNVVSCALDALGFRKNDSHTYSTLYCLNCASEMGIPYCK